MAERRAPVQGDPWSPDNKAETVPWEVHERAWLAYGQPKYPGDNGRYGQDAERIAYRSGFGYREMQCLLAGHYNDSCGIEHPAVPGWEPRANP